MRQGGPWSYPAACRTGSKTLNMKPENRPGEYLECQGGLFRAVDWERERDQWRTRFAVVLSVAIAGWATVAVLVALV